MGTSCPSDGRNSPVLILSVCVEATELISQSSTKILCFVALPLLGCFSCLLCPPPLRRVLVPTPVGPLLLPLLVFSIVIYNYLHWSTTTWASVENSKTAILRLANRTTLAAAAIGYFIQA
jgi:glucan phosphoethanolaminetransferase (alkaline phosphatase superfamily)